MTPYDTLCRDTRPSSCVCPQKTEDRRRMMIATGERVGVPPWRPPPPEGNQPLDVSSRVVTVHANHHRLIVSGLTLFPSLFNDCDSTQTTIVSIVSLVNTD